MIGTWNVWTRSLRSRVALTAALLVTLVAAQGCTLPGPEQWEDFAHRAEQIAATRPRAWVDISPDTFCIGEIETVTWDGGAQFDDCDPSTPDPVDYPWGFWGWPPDGFVLSDTTDCKAASQGVGPGATGGANFTDGFEAYNLNGSASFTADIVHTITASYRVQWDGWADRRAFRYEVPDMSGRFTRPTGIAWDQDSATPITADSYFGGYRDILVCDETTRTWRFGRVEDSSTWGTPEEYISDAVSSACVAITEICIPETLFESLGRLQISVEGGPSFVLGGESGPRCTDVFRGYHPEDIRIEPLDRSFGFPEAEYGYGSPCTPGEAHYWHGQSVLGYHIAGSSLCATGPTTPFPGSWSRGSVESLEFGTVELLGVSRDRCLAALDPLFLADLGLAAPMVPMSLTPDPATCDLSQSCGDGVCNLLCESPNTCPADCTFSTQGGACYDSCDPDDPTGCLAGLSCLPRVLGGDQHICYNSTICTLGVTLEPGVTQSPDQPLCTCGDGVCEQSRCSEFQQNCPADCGQSQPSPTQPPPPTQPAPVCGDGACNGGETCWSCSADCGPC